MVVEWEVLEILFGASLKARHFGCLDQSRNDLGCAGLSCKLFLQASTKATHDHCKKKVFGRKRLEPACYWGVDTRLRAHCQCQWTLSPTAFKVDEW